MNMFVENLMTFVAILCAFYCYEYMLIKEVKKGESGLFLTLKVYSN